ncbi:MAG: hypothetical protein IKG70_08835 [Lachnospiraceae bacterium]|nr:hypothetical protein [Lachnospiraceae bacterium]
MIRNLLSKITHNFPLKLVSVVLAVVLWYAAIYYSDPKETRSYSVRIDVINESYIASGKQVFYIDDIYKTVTVYINDNASILSRINAGNITVTADLTQIVDFNRDPVMVPLSVQCTGVDQTNISLSRETIPIRIENVDSKELPITISTGDTVPNKNYEVGTLTPEVSSIVVNGPESIISQIDSVVAHVNVSNMTTDGERKATLSFIDKDQNIISEDLINDSITIEGDYSNLSVYVELWKKRSGITFNINYTGTPATDFRVYQTTTSPDEITVVGNSDALTSLEAAGNAITIPSDRINVEGASDDVTVDVVISDLLPDNMRISASMNDYITVTVSIMPVDSKKISYDVDRIDIINLQEKLSISYSKTTVEIKVKTTGTKKLTDLTADDLTVQLDASSLTTAGEFELPAAVTLPEGYELVDDVIIPVVVKEIAADTTTNKESNTVSGATTNNG